MKRYLRQTMIPEFGEQGQRKLHDSSVVIIGLGGLGAPVATYLTASGIGRIGLCDNDTVSLSNLQRQILYTENDLGLPKTQCALNRLRSMSSATRFDIIKEGLNEKNAIQTLAEYDIVIDCTDNFATRLLIDHTCASIGKTWVHGSINGFYGTVTTFNHRNAKRYIDLYPDAEELAKEQNGITGTLGPVPGVVGSIQAIEAIKCLTSTGECLDGRILTIDLLNMTIETIEF